MKKIIDLINAAKSVAVLGHVCEDADSVGSSLAIAYALQRLGKRAKIYFSAPLEARLGFIETDGIIYDGEACEEHDLCLCVDCCDMGRLGRRSAIFDAAEHTVSIDHHFTNTYFAEANLVIPDASATGEILYDVVSALGVKPDKTLAEYLFIAIASDTGSFKYSNVSPKTLRVCADLLETGIDNAYLSRMLFDTETEESMHFRGYLMGRTATFCDGKLAMIAVRRQEFEQFGIEEKDMGDIVNIARLTAGAEIAVSVRETADRIKLSFRSNGKYDVSQLAMKFGGGGHKMASGASVTDIDFDAVCARVKEFCGEMING